MKSREEIEGKLDANLCSSRVKKNDYSGHDHIESWDAIRLANEVFGFTGWTSRIDDMKQVSATKAENGTFEIAYMATVTVTVTYSEVVDGSVRLLETTRQGSGVGLGFKKKLGDAHEMAIKNAETDAEKRALRKFGNPFGLALYDKDRKYVSDLTTQASTSGSEKVSTLNNSASDNFNSLVRILDDWANSLYCLEDLNTVKFMDIDNVSGFIESLSDQEKDLFRQKYQDKRQSVINSFTESGSSGVNNVEI